MWISDLVVTTGCVGEWPKKTDFAGEPKTVVFNRRQGQWAPPTDADLEETLVPDIAETLVPIVFGRPNFSRDIKSIGNTRPDVDVHTFVCGNGRLVEDLEMVVAGCNQQCQDEARGQTYYAHFERFG
mmetsp:Transcript_16061/g.37573  ORF Transcript_16061/g.37573 Transcript_16061/m.37573 type:complete len:127 (+) Transcript_16061:2041-2421(+)